MKLANATARELARRNEGRPRNRETCLRGRAIDEVCPRSGPVTQHLRRPTTTANILELEETA